MQSLDFSPLLGRYRNVITKLPRMVHPQVAAGRSQKWAAVRIGAGAARSLCHTLRKLHLLASRSLATIIQCLPGVVVVR